MSGVRLDYSINDSKPLAMLQRLENFNARAMFDDIGGYLDSEVANRFVEGKDPDGNTWEPLSDATLFARIGGAKSRKKRGGTRIGAIRKLAGISTLINRGNLRDSITHNTFIDGSGVEHGSNKVYAAIHQFGGQAGRGKSVTIPARPFLGINGGDESMIDNIVEDHLRMTIR